MKNLNLILIPFLVLCLYGGCNDSSNFDCEFLFNSDLVNSECLAEDVVNLCSFLVCETESQSVSSATFRSTCSATDCDTIECIDRSFTELTIDSEGNLFSIVILQDENLGIGECGFAQN